MTVDEATNVLNGILASDDTLNDAIDIATEALEMMDPMSPSDVLIDRECVEYRCGKCKMVLSPQNNYCPNCGQATKWDETPFKR